MVSKKLRHSLIISSGFITRRQLPGLSNSFLMNVYSFANHPIQNVSSESNFGIQYFKFEQNVPRS